MSWPRPRPSPAPPKRTPEGFKDHPTDVSDGAVTLSGDYNHAQTLAQDWAPLALRPLGECSAWGDKTTLILHIPVARRLYLAPFDNPRRERFLSLWFRLRNHPDRTQRLIEQIEQIDKPGHEGLRFISRIPNLLYYMAMLVRKGTNLPDGRAELYRRVADNYLRVIEEKFYHTHTNPNGHPPPVSHDRSRLLLRRLAVTMLKACAQPSQRADTGTNRIHTDALIAALSPQIERWLREPAETPGRPSFADQHPSSTPAEIIHRILKHLSRRSGLLLDIGPEHHGFVHLSYLEFFASEWLGTELDRLRDRDALETQLKGEDCDDIPAELDRQYPAPSPLDFSPREIEALAHLTAWHEPLIYLAETRDDNETRLARYLFPCLLETGRQALRLPLPPRSSSG